MELTNILKRKGIKFEKINDKLLINADCLEVLRYIPHRSIDLIFTDPPYDLNDVNLTPLTGVQKDKVSKEFRRVLKQSGNVAIMAGKLCKWEWYNKLTKYGFKLHSEFIWIHSNPPQFAIPLKNKRSFVWSHDTILCFRLSNNNYFNTNELVTNPKEAVDWIKHPTLIGILRGSEDGVPVEKINTTPRPQKVARRIIKFMMPKGGVLLDPFMGTGTFVAYTDDRAIGIEKNPDIFDIAVDRVRNLSKQKKLEIW